MSKTIIFCKTLHKCSSHWWWSLEMLFTVALRAKKLVWLVSTTPIHGQLAKKDWLHLFRKWNQVHCNSNKCPNLPDIRYVVNWGLAKTILDQLQEARRVGRDRLQSYVVAFYHGQQLAHCEKEVKESTPSSGCFRVAAFQSLDNSIQPLHLHLPHDCCNYCSSVFQCAGSKCSAEIPPFE